MFMSGIKHSGQYENQGEKVICFAVEMSDLSVREYKLWHIRLGTPVREV